MQTHLQKIMSMIQDLEREAIHLSGQDHLPEDLFALVKNAGAALELFLKSHIHVGQSWKLHRLIDQLDSLGVSAADIEMLHNLRNNYNSPKHDPSYGAHIDEIIKILKDTSHVLQGWIGSRYGNAEQFYRPIYKRRMWLAGWDHYVHGDGEVHIMIPVGQDDVDFVPSLDVIYLKGLAWPSVLDKLGPAVSLADGIIPQRFLDMWSQEGDFADARVYYGDYRELIRTLASEELRLDLIPFLKRENDSSSMRNAVAIAAVDAAAGYEISTSESDFKEKIIDTASSEYACPSSSKFVRQFAEKFAKAIFNVPEEQRRSVTGPRFVNSINFQRQMKSSSYSDQWLLLNDHLELFINI